MPTMDKKKIKNQEMDEEIKKLKEVEYYSAAANAWFNTRIERDKSFLTISIAGIGWLTTLQTIHENKLGCFLVVTYVCFLVCVISVLVILHKNSTHIEKVLSGEEQTSSLLRALNYIASISFATAILFAAIWFAASYSGKG